MSDNNAYVAIIIAVCLSLTTCGVAAQWRVVELAKIEAAQ